MVSRRWAARVAAPAAFLLAVTVFIMLVRAGLDSGDETAASGRSTVVTTTPSGRNDGATTTAPTTNAAKPVFVQVQAGDTLQGIADRRGTTVERLLQLNPDLDPTGLQIGQRVRVR